MANKNRANIASQIYEYLPRLNTSSKTTLVNNAIDAAVETISHRHDFRCLRSATPDTATMTAGQYSAPMTSFGTVGSDAACFKGFLKLFQMKANAEDHNEIEFLDDASFHDRFGYVDYASRSPGKPRFYTRLANTLLFDCPVDEAITLRGWWQKYHGPFAADTSTHQFQPKDNMLAFNTILYFSLMELKSSLTGVEIPQELVTAEQRAEMLLQELIARDKDIPNESFSFGWGERSSCSRGNTDPYSWV